MESFLSCYAKRRTLPYDALIKNKMALTQLIENFEKVIGNYLKLSYDEIVERADEISILPDVIDIRKQFAKFMDNGRSNLEQVLDEGITRVREKYEKDLGIVIPEEPEKYQEVEVICDEHTNTHVLGKGLFPEGVAPEDLHFKKSNLIYSHYAETITNGKLICTDCGAYGQIGGIVDTRILAPVVNDESKSNLVDMIMEEFTFSFNEKAKIKRSRKELQEEITLISRTLGFEDCFHAFRASKTFSANLYDMFPNDRYPNYAKFLLGPVAEYIPNPVMSITLGEKMSKSLPTKYLLAKYGKEKRHLHDICRARLVTYSLESCLQIVHLFEDMAVEGIFQIKHREDNLFHPKPSGFKSYNLDIDLCKKGPSALSNDGDINPPIPTGIISEIQIKTNDMDNKSEMDHRQAHRYRRIKQKEMIRDLLEKGTIPRKEYLLVNIIMDVDQIKSYRAR